MAANNSLDMNDLMDVDSDDEDIVEETEVESDVEGGRNSSLGEAVDNNGTKLFHR